MRHLILLAVLPLPACVSEDPDPIVGTWSIQTTLSTTHDAACPDLTGYSGVSTITIAADHTVTLDGEGDIEDGALRFTTISFVDTADGSSYDSLLGATLLYDPTTDSLSGDGFVGCGGDCSYDLAVTGTRSE